MKTATAKGTFTVQLQPLPAYNTDENSLMGRMSIDKQFQGDLEGVSKGEMVAARTAINNSAGYVAIECVQGSIHGLKGAFVLQHSSTMNRGEATQSINVVPDSGTDELTGLAGSLTIMIVEKQHYYDFEYNLPE
jgi:predicted flavoprotein YhiN